MKRQSIAATLVAVALTSTAGAQQPPANPVPTVGQERPSTPVSTTGTADRPASRSSAVPDAATRTAPDPAAASDPNATAPDPKPSPAAAALPLDPRAADMMTAYQIGAEDMLDISVWKQVELSRTVPVRPDGMVSLPLVNDIHAAGLTPGELRDQITSKLSEYIPAPEVSVIVREVHSRKVTITGAVKMPGRYELRSPMTVLEALALAQGLTDFASRDKIAIIRYVDGKNTRIPFNYRKIADGGAQENFFLRPGDIVIVP